ncbi:MAG: ATP-binding cassette domain-containing protein [Deltaproteobacteria bacterium]|jgi:energy-coupling factor transport system ATP-binding protein|nr:ATP-binding cassette domain-containing protein [Deltaproteobacteria bacterium]
MLSVKALSYRHAHAEGQALKNLTFTLEPGQSLLLTGRSGSGKSTLLSILAGLYPHFLKGSLEGQALLDGQEAGQGRVTEWGQGARLMLQNSEAQFFAGTVEEEVLLTLRCRGVTGAQADQITKERLGVMGLLNLREHSVFKLSEGQKQKAVLAALTALRPKLLLLDEPSANLDPLFLADLKSVLKSLRKEGLALIVADHRLYWLQDLCEKLIVLDQGQIAFEGSFDHLNSSHLRQKLGLRSAQIPKAPKLPSPRDLKLPALPKVEPVSQPDSLSSAPDHQAKKEMAVTVKNLFFAYPDGQELFGGLSLSLAAGEVTALTGPSGRGKTTLARLLCGLEKPLQGTVTYDGQKADLKLGQVVLQNADHQLYMPTVLSEMVLAFGQGRLGPDIKAQAMELLEAFNLAPLADRHPQSLSGGEKQRLVVAVGLARPTKLLALDEPTSGLDGHNLSLMAKEIRKAAQAGPAVLVVTHDLELVNLCADRQLELFGPQALKAQTAR